MFDNSCNCRLKNYWTASMMHHYLLRALQYQEHDVGAVMFGRSQHDKQNKQTIKLPSRWLMSKEWSWPTSQALPISNSNNNIAWVYVTLCMYTLLPAVLLCFDLSCAFLPHGRNWRHFNEDIKIVPNPMLFVQTRSVFKLWVEAITPLTFPLSSTNLHKSLGILQFYEQPIFIQVWGQFRTSPAVAVWWLICTQYFQQISWSWGWICKYVQERYNLATSKRASTKKCLFSLATWSLCWNSKCFWRVPYTHEYPSYKRGGSFCWLLKREGSYSCKVANMISLSFLKSRCKNLPLSYTLWSGGWERLVLA
jgi:hypothetical protein